MHHKLETTASADWRTEYGHNRIATAAHGRTDPDVFIMTTDSTASIERRDPPNDSYVPTDDEVEQLAELLLDRLDEQGSPTYVRQQRIDTDVVKEQRRGYAFRAVDDDPELPIRCTVWSEHSTLWQVRRVPDRDDEPAAAGGRA
jgi:hypothetical protein